MDKFNMDAAINHAEHHYNGNAKEDYDFLTSSGIELNEYQFKKIFLRDRQQGKSFATLMELVLKVKHSGSLEITYDLIQDLMRDSGEFESRNISNNIIRYMYRDFIRIMETYFKDDIIIHNSTNNIMTIKMEYNNAKFKSNHPEYYI
jgi:hypothetical protein